MNRSRKTRRRFKAERFVKHLSRFVDCRRFPNFQITPAIVTAESKRQSHGEGNLSDEQRRLVEPLRDAQRWKEVTIDGLVEEMAEWWSKNWGWWYPIMAEIKRVRGDWVMRKALLEIRRRCEDDFLGFLIAREGCERFISQRL